MKNNHYLRIIHGIFLFVDALPLYSVVNREYTVYKKLRKKIFSKKMNTFGNNECCLIKESPCILYIFGLNNKPILHIPWMANLFQVPSKLLMNLRWKSEYPWCIIEVKSKHFPTVFKKFEKNKKKMTEKREFLRKTSFRPNRFFYMVVIQKLITVNTRNFHQMLMSVVSVYMRLNFKCLRNRVTITIYPQTILNICYYSKSISRRYLKILPNLNFGVFGPLKHKPPFSPTTGNYILG
ncbi:hypothetical protein AGLY_005875 [Aphis glycines]|uniref:Uncharacterized protein n=1 Tax=Aphis glycines TaxID=307491 RepID=A0A6G0TSN6_APHGL|nr:hypothetical protein AGLY_005875 [Aphis glycines]